MKTLTDSSGTQHFATFDPNMKVGGGGDKPVVLAPHETELLTR